MGSLCLTGWINFFFTAIKLPSFFFMFLFSSQLCYFYAVYHYTSICSTRELIKVPANTSSLTTHLRDGLSPRVTVRPLTSEMQKKELAWLFALYIVILFERRLKLYFFLGHKKNCVFSFVASYAFLMSINQRTYITCHYFRLNRRLGISLENSHLRV